MPLFSVYVPPPSHRTHQGPWVGRTFSAGFSLLYRGDPGVGSVLKVRNTHTAPLLVTHAGVGRGCVAGKHVDARDGSERRSEVSGRI